MASQQVIESLRGFFEEAAQNGPERARSVFSCHGNTNGPVGPQKRPTGRSGGLA